MTNHKRRELESLRTAYECDPALAHLRVKAIQYVPGDGPLKPLAVILGEAPGANEDRTGRPFVGKSGKILVDLLAAFRLTREDFYLTNVVKYRPTANRNPTLDEIKSSHPYLVQELAQVSTGHVIAVGRIAMDAMFMAKSDRGAPPVSQTHGYYYEDLLENKVVWSTYHPSAAQYRPELIDVLLDDFEYILGKIRG